MSKYFDELKKKMTGVADATPVSSDPDVAVSPISDDHDQSDTSTPLDPKMPENGNIVPKRAPGKLIIDNIAEKRFFLTQTLIKEITDQYGNVKENLCPKNIYERYITKQYRYVTQPMVEGIFGETLILGGGAKGQKVTDLEKHKKTGAKLKAQLNIEEQSRRFPYLCMEKGIAVHKGINTQLPITKRFNNNVLIRTEIDLFPTPFYHNGELRIAVIDLKFTANTKSEWGDFSWAQPERMDHLQADITYWLLKEFDWELNLKFNPDKEEVYNTIFNNPMITQAIDNNQIMFIYMVLGYRKEPLEEQVEFIHRSYFEPNGTTIRQKEWMERARKTLANLSEWRQQDWPYEPGNHCKNCPVSKFNGGYCTETATMREI